MNLYAFLLSFLASISTIIGFFVIFIKKDKSNIISLSLGLASGVMLCVSITDLMPNAMRLLINSTNIPNTIFCLVFGFLTGIMITNVFNKLELKKDKLYNVGIISMIAIILHNIPEGIITYITASSNINLGIKLTVAIALHNIPEGITISIPIFYSTKNKFKAFLYTFLSGFSELIGSIVCYLFLSKYINNIVLGIIYSVIAGMMINISINDLYKESITYNKRYTNTAFIIGIIFIIINHFVFS